VKLGLTVLAFAGVLVCAALAAQEPAATDALFPASDEVKPPLRVPRDVEITVDADGDYLIDGRARFLLGPQVAEAVKAGQAPTAGYDASLKWLYEDVLGYEAAQRLGFDTASYFVPEGWFVEQYGPDALSAWNRQNDEDLKAFIAGIGLPLYVDFTASPWSHGMLRDRPYVPREALNSGGVNMPLNHWVPYSATHPEGLRLYRAMWEYGVRHMKESGGRALFYELFNEPAYHDPSDYTRRLFAERLAKEYGTIQALNDAWHTNYRTFEEAAAFKDRSDNPALFVEWCKFMEDAFAGLCREGVKTIQAHDPGARCCVQVMGGDLYRALPKTGVNLYKLSQFLGSSSTCTGGAVSGSAGLSRAPEHAVSAPSVKGSLAEGMLHRRFILSISRGKPIHDGEAYIGNSRESLMDMLWLQLARGGNAAYLFKWDKRAWDRDWGEDKSAEGGRRVAEKFPYLILDPYAVPTKALTGIMDFEQQMLRVADLLCPRGNRAKARVAVLLSYPTERYAAATGSSVQDAILYYSAALQFSHFATDVILEEQLAEGRQDEYDVIVAAGVSNVHPATLERLSEFVRGGGVLILGLEAMQADELGNGLEWGDLAGLRLGPPEQGAVSPLTLNLERYPLLPGEIKARPYREAAAGGSWKPVAGLGRAPAVLARDSGAGRIYFVGAEMADYGLAAALSSILAAHGIAPVCRLSRPDGELAVNVEVDRADSGGLTAWFLYNWDRYPKLVRLQDGAIARAGAAADALDGYRYPVERDGASVLLPPHRRVVVVAGPAEELGRRYGPLRPVTRRDLEEMAAGMAPPAWQPTEFEQNFTRTPVFEDDLPAHWILASWGGVDLEPVEEPALGGKGRALLAAVAGDATDWCGCRMSADVRPGEGDGGPDITQQMRREGFLSFYVNGSDDEWGTHKGEQSVQVKIDFRTAGGTEWDGGPFIGMGQYIDGGMVDDDPDTWQKVQIPLRRLLAGQQADRLGGVWFQYQGAPPSAGLAIDSVALEVQDRPPGF
jgi:hypothetical protein